MSVKKNSINRQTLGRLWRAIMMFIRSSVGRKAKLMMICLLSLMLGINGMNVVNSYVARYFMSAIERQDMHGFIYLAWVYAGVFIASTVLAVFFRFTEERLGLLWREWMTHRIVGFYLDQQVYLRLGSEGTITNPDQRISEDVRFLTTATLSFVLMILNSTITTISFAGVLWAISPILFLVSVIYAAIGSVLTLMLGGRLVKLNYQQADFEANFRASLIKVRENAEAIASSGAEQKTKNQLFENLEQVIGNLKHIISVNRNLGFFTTGYNYMIQLIPILFVAPLFIRGGIDFGIIGQSSMAFATMVGAFSLIVTQFQSISAYAAVTTRLAEFVEASES